MLNIKRSLLNGLLFAAFAVVPFAVGESAQPQNTTPKVENSEVSWWYGYGRPYYYYRPYYRPYYYNYYPYRPYYYNYWY